MVNANANSPNKKRKSLPNMQNKPQTPKKAKLNESLRTPGNNNAAPANTTNTPKPAAFQKRPGNTPRKFPGPNAKSPLNTQGPRNPGKQNNRNNKKPFGNKGASPKKLKMFPGTSKPQQSQNKKTQAKNADKSEKKSNRKRAQFHGIKEKVKSGDQEVIQELEKRIKAIENRSELTKTGRRKLKLLLKLRNTVQGVKAEPPSTSQKKRQRKQDAKGKQLQKKAEQVQPKPETSDKPQEEKNVVAVTKDKEDDGNESSESSDYEMTTEPGKIIKTTEETVEQEESSNEDEEEEGSEEASDEEEESVEEDAEAEENSDEEDSEENSGEEESGEEQGSDEGQEKQEEKKGKNPQLKQVKTPDLKKLEEGKIISKGQTRYVLFVGNLPYDATKQEISEHFKKAGEIRHVRIPTEKNTNKPRGFAYVEFDNEIAYQKGLSLHHTFIKGRQINVLYTQGGKRKGPERKNEVKAKNLKLQAMRKQGQLAGSVKANQKRSARRAKKNAMKTSFNGSSA